MNLLEDRPSHNRCYLLPRNCHSYMYCCTLGFLYVLPFCYPYILLHFKCFLLLGYVIFSSLSTCLSRGLPSHSSRSLSQAATDIWKIDSGISYTGSIRWRITGPSVLSQPFSGWKTKPAKDRGYTRTDGSRHSKSMDNTSLNHSDVFILMIGTYLSLFKCLVRLTTQRTLGFFDRPPMPSRAGTQLANYY